MLNSYEIDIGIGYCCGDVHGAGAVQAGAMRLSDCVRIIGTDE